MVVVVVAVVQTVRTKSASAMESNGAGGTGAGNGQAGVASAACAGGGGGGSGSVSNMGGGNPGSKCTSLLPSSPAMFLGVAPQTIAPGSGRAPSGNADIYYPATEAAVGGLGSAGSGSNGLGARRGGEGYIVILL